MNSVGRWIVYGFLSALAIAIIAFPDQREERRVSFTHHPSLELRRAQFRWIVQSELLRRAHSREVAREAISASRKLPDTNSFELVRPAGVSDAIVDGVRALAKRILATPRRDSSMRVMVVFTIDTGATVAGVPTHRAGWWSSTDTFFPGAVAANACVIVVRTTAKTTFNASRTDFGGHPCYWYGAYGVPGRGIATMLDSTSSKAITVHDRRVAGGTDSYFDYAIDGDTRALKCRAGNRSMCELLLLGAPQRSDNLLLELPTSKWAGAGRMYGRNSDYLPGVLLSRMERELGDKDFARIWKSDKPVAASFADVRGETLGDWIHELVVSQLDTRDSGPVPDPRVWLAFGIALPALIAVGTLGASRRSGLG